MIFIFAINQISNRLKSNIHITTANIFNKDALFCASAKFIHNSNLIFHQANTNNN